MPQPHWNWSHPATLVSAPDMGYWQLCVVVAHVGQGDTVDNSSSGAKDHWRPAPFSVLHAWACLQHSLGMPAAQPLPWLQSMPASAMQGCRQPCRVAHICAGLHTAVGAGLQAAMHAGLHTAMQGCRQPCRVAHSRAGLHTAVQRCTQPCRVAGSHAHSHAARVAGSHVVPRAGAGTSRLCCGL
jgi:hypothetical protein